MVTASMTARVPQGQLHLARARLRRGGQREGTVVRASGVRVQVGDRASRERALEGSVVRAWGVHVQAGDPARREQELEGSVVRAWGVHVQAGDPARAAAAGNPIVAALAALEVDSELERTLEASAGRCGEVVQADVRERVPGSGNGVSVRRVPLDGAVPHGRAESDLFPAVARERSEAHLGAAISLRAKVRARVLRARVRNARVQEAGRRARHAPAPHALAGNRARVEGGPGVLHAARD
jgi:hypothetical protein